MGLQQQLAKRLMNAFPAFPDPADLSLYEVFHHSSYTAAPPEKQREIRLSSASFRYDYERENCLITHFFPELSAQEFRDKTVLDLGCFTGGRLVYWKEKFGFGETHGIDINPLFETAGNEFAQEKGVDVTFATGFAENLPYDENYFDIVVSFDVFEHVKDVKKTLDECHRILKPGGTLLTVFPPFYQPLESHMGLTTRLHALHWFFSASALSRAICEIHEQRGETAAWYAIRSDKIDTWEVLPSLNGITCRKFRAMLEQDSAWRVVSRNTAPILSSGRRSKQWPFPWLKRLFSLPARLPILEELFLDRICVTLQKR